jgi:hypothetical protein
MGRRKKPRQRSKRNVTYRELYACCDSAAKQAGSQWYATAHAQCRAIGRETGYDINIVAAVVSALSPSVNWADNVQWAARLLRAASVREVFAGYPGYKANAYKAWAIARKECKPEDAFDERKSPKTWAFWRNLRDPEEWRPVTIDRWMLRVRGCQEKITWKTYNALAEEIRETARECGVVPNAVQAALWCVARERGTTRNAAASERT